MSDFDVNDLLGVPGLEEPRPDEDAWEAYLEFALERIGGERSPGLTNREIGELETMLGCQLPFEVGLMLVMGVPTAAPWHQWEDPVTQLAASNERLVSGLSFAVEHDDFWFPAWGAKPGSLDEQLAVVAEQFTSSVPALLPIYGDRLVPLTAAEGQANSDGNPILSVHHGEVQVVGDDLAAWMHHDFEVPLPMWPSQQRTFAFWSELVS